jgi:L-ascorbate metabolism protein UlaG (beta-lactamase superfamily)
MLITWFGHSAFRLEIGDKIVLIDPFLTGNPSFKGDVASVTEGTTHILLTHGHGDHVGDTVEIAQRTGAKVVADADLCGWLGTKGVKNLDPMNTGGTTEQGGFSVTMVQAFHSSGMVEHGVAQNLGDPHGVIVTVPDGHTLYHMGDTGIFGDMELINELYEPTIGLVPIGDRFTMGGKVAAYACREFFDFDVVVPCHYGSFPIIDQTPDVFLAGMDGLESTHVIVPDVGKPFEV